MAAPHTTIYLRNTFRLKRRDWYSEQDQDKDYGKMFIEGKEAFVRYTLQRNWRLIAAFGEWPLLKDGVLVEPGCEMVQIWQLPAWDTLYETMTAVSESSWYRNLGESLASEDHELLINAGVLRPNPQRRWLTDSEPGYSYFYEVVRPRQHRHHAYLRDVYWLTAWMSSVGWELVWWASQITAQPAELAVLWRVPNPGGVTTKSMPQALFEIAEQQRTRYDHMTSILQSSERRIYYPIYTERMAELVESKAGPAQGTP